MDYDIFSCLKMNGEWSRAQTWGVHFAFSNNDFVKPLLKWTHIGRFFYTFMQPALFDITARKQILQGKRW